MDINIIDFILAIIPIAWLFVALLGLKMEAYKACLGALIFSCILAFARWDMPMIDLATAMLEGILFTLWPILLIVIAAVFTYRVTTFTGAIENIKEFISGISTDKRVLVLLIAWGFAGFMEGVAGYGAPIAIGAGMLWGMGLDPVLASTACIIANMVTTTFGAISIAILTTAEVTNLGVDILSFATIVQLAIPLLLTPFIMILIVSKGKLKSLKGVRLIALISGLSFLLTQIVTLKYVATEMLGVLPPIVSLACTIFSLKYIGPKEIPKEYDLAESMNDKKDIDIFVPERSIFVAALPFILILTLFLLTSSLFPNINRVISSVKTNVLVYTGANPNTLSFQWIDSPGLMILISTLIGGLLQGARLKQLGKIFIETIKQIYKIIFTLLAIIATAKVISYSGMIAAISSLIIFVAGSFYPYIAPLLGMVGGFITGSGTASGILFGVVQVDAGSVLGVSGLSLVAANSIGSSIGKVMSPQAIAMAASTTGLSGEEGKIFTESIKWISVYIFLACIISGLASRFVF